MSLLYKLFRFERAGLADGKELLLGYNEDIVAVFSIGDVGIVMCWRELRSRHSNLINIIIIYILQSICAPKFQ